MCYFMRVEITKICITFIMCITILLKWQKWQNKIQKTVFGFLANLQVVPDFLHNMNYTLISCAEFCCIMSCFVLMYFIALYCIVLCCIVFYCIVLCCFVFYFSVLYCIVLHCVLLYCIMSPEYSPVSQPGLLLCGIITLGVRRMICYTTTIQYKTGILNTIHGVIIQCITSIYNTKYQPSGEGGAR